MRRFLSKWRPSEKDCLYVIPDIHGAYDLLKLILKQILPLRKSDGGKDHLVFLGDYIDRNIHSIEVIDLLIQIKKAYPNQVHFVMGNHEQLVLKAFNKYPRRNFSLQDREVAYRTWLANGGYSTVEGYVHRYDPSLSMELMDFPKHRLEIMIPNDHWQFYQELLPFYEMDNFLFIHAGCDPYEDIEKQEHEVLLWDRSLCKMFTQSSEFDWVQWEHTIITGHNGSYGIVNHPKFKMLDAGSPERLLCVELRSGEAVMALPGYTRLVKVDISKL